MIVIFQSTLPAWGATVPSSPRGLKAKISIHAPRVGSDNVSATLRVLQPISIHAPRVGSDVRVLLLLLISKKFQSTLPAWGATFNVWPSRTAERFQSTLPAWGATLPAPSAHATDAFQSTLPAWGATVITDSLCAVVKISIHAPRVGSDALSGKSSSFSKFQSTLPAWGAT